jgi:hypothetical protein
VSAKSSGSGRENPPAPHPWQSPDPGAATADEALLHRLAAATTHVPGQVYLRAKSLFDERWDFDGLRLPVNTAPAVLADP